MAVSNITYGDGTLRGRVTTDDATGNKHGISTYYHPDGTTTEATITYDQGTESGVCLYYYPDGGLRASVVKSAGVVTALTLFAEGSNGRTTQRRLAFDRNGKVDGTITHNDGEGVQISSQTWAAGANPDVARRAALRAPTPPRSQPAWVS